MSEIGKARHLVLVRHGESEGDVRRGAWKQGKSFESIKHPADENQTPLGHEQSKLAGEWIGQYILKNYAIVFDACFVSPMTRTMQSARSLGLTTNWQSKELLTERDRGKVAGLTRTAHESLFPDSYNTMRQHPFHWVPPDGESILRVADRATKFLGEVSQYRAVLVMTHRDWIWAAHLPLENASLQEMEAMDTDDIHNGQVIHYTNVNPFSGEIDGDELAWKRSVCPWTAPADLYSATQQWVKLGNDDRLEGAA
jgi:broad specificity phosphatase PhoE